MELVTSAIGGCTGYIQGSAEEDLWSSSSPRGGSGPVKAAILARARVNVHVADFNQNDRTVNSQRTIKFLFFSADNETTA